MFLSCPHMSFWTEGDMRLCSAVYSKPAGIVWSSHPFLEPVTPVVEFCRKAGCPVTWQQLCQTGSGKEIRAVVCTDPWKKHGGLTRWLHVPVLDWAVAGTEGAMPPLQEGLLISLWKTPRCSPPVTVDVLIQLGAEVCWWSLFSFMPPGTLQATSSAMVQFGTFLWNKVNKQKRHRKATQSTTLSGTCPTCAASRSRVGNREKTVHNESRYCSLYKCYCITCSLFFKCQKNLRNGIIQEAYQNTPPF